MSDEPLLCPNCGRPDHPTCVVELEAALKDVGAHALRTFSQKNARIAELEAELATARAEIARLTAERDATTVSAAGPLFEARKAAAEIAALRTRVADLEAELVEEQNDPVLVRVIAAQRKRIVELEAGNQRPRAAPANLQLVRFEADEVFSRLDEDEADRLRAERDQARAEASDAGAAQVRAQIRAEAADARLAAVIA